ncbi:hypothetical protein RHMOL_Rhmol01G0360500 [Rhododendron molle]|uniref:Uncharacterized protein n=1 Tax=Rhododendron molle TaxID=49168 RepID=A0ACC0Q9R4_RHOML|nr:hypothetical protein RHMOL_Rhmol01G0360500 [Rhododendron molle]
MIGVCLLNRIPMCNCRLLNLLNSPPIIHRYLYLCKETWMAKLLTSCRNFARTLQCSYLEQ